MHRNSPNCTQNFKNFSGDTPKPPQSGGATPPKSTPRRPSGHLLPVLRCRCKAGLSRFLLSEIWSSYSHSLISNNNNQPTNLCQNVTRSGEFALSIQTLHDTSNHQHHHQLLSSPQFLSCTAKCAYHQMQTLISSEKGNCISGPAEQSSATLYEVVSSSRLGQGGC